ncbi:MAG: hypothetical protein HC883_00660 [Bdellovibrionaceae bacterium]|nr:hypothetical protein [Pseudobdellovibrionaceae bacterium]
MRLFSAGLTEVGSGLFLGLDGVQIPLWENAENILFDRWGAHPASGYSVYSYSTDLFDSLIGNFDSLVGNFDSLSSLVSIQASGDEITGLLQTLTTLGERVLFYGTREKLWRNLGTQTDVSSTTYTGFQDSTSLAAATRWSMAAYGFFVFATNGQDIPQIYKTGPTFIDVVDVQCTTAEIVRIIGPHVLLINTSNGYNRVEWCAEDNVDIWNPATDPTAGNLTIRTIASPIIAAEPLLGNALLLYHADGVNLLEYRGGQFLFSAPRGAKGITAVSKNSVVATGNVHWGLTQDGIFRTDGRTFDWISYPQLGRWLRDNVNWEQKAKISGVHDAEQQLVKWSLPRNSTTNNIVLAVHYAKDEIRYATESSAFSVAIERGSLEAAFAGFANGTVLKFDTNVAPVPRVLETKALACADSDRFKYLDIVRVLKTGTNFVAEIAFLDRIGDTPVWEPLSLSTTPTELLAYTRREALYFKLRFTCADPNARWTITGLELLGAMTGGRFYGAA